VFSLFPHFSRGIILEKIRKVNDEATFVSCGGECCCFLLTGFICIFCCHPPIFQSCRDRLLNEYYSPFSPQLTLSSALRNINRDFFQSHPVFFSAPSGNVLINMSTLPSLNGNSVNTPLHQQYPQSAYSPSYTLQQQHQPQQQQPIYTTAYPAQDNLYYPPQNTSIPAAQVVSVSTANQSAFSGQVSFVPTLSHDRPPLTHSPALLSISSPQYIVTTDVTPGSQIQVRSPTGTYVIITVPKTAVPGDVIHYTY
jgi:hypothetical protein